VSDQPTTDNTESTPNARPIDSDEPSTSLPPAFVTFGAIAGLLVAAVLGLLGGMNLSERHSQPGTQTTTVESPRSAPASDRVLHSPAGFTGFESGALTGTVTRTGAITEATTSGPATTFTIADGPSTMTVQATATTRLYRITEATTSLAPGNIIIVAIDTTSAPTAILRIPPDLREGDAR